MAGVKRRTKYRKNVAQELDEFPELEEDDLFARVLGSRGGNLFDVESQDGVTALCRLPTRFRKMVWIKRGSYILVVQAADDVEVVNGKGKAKVLFAAKAILMDHQIKHFKRLGLWPEYFMTSDEIEESEQAIADAEDEEQEEVPAKDTGVEGGDAGDAGGAADEDEANVQQLSAAEKQARLLERYMYEEESSEDDDLLMPQNRNRAFADSDESDSGDSDDSDE
eukprot:INCI19308.1.p1 GENE.INCI19308.1~~INCI19308.1.p1  ORF type:complete len:223 (-),score=64.23 INCI19308.1:770-1438(-)